MQKIQLGEIKSVKDYHKERSKAHQHIMSVKAPRRIIIGPYLNFLFENKDTMLYQVQEMVYTENITDTKAIQHEIDVYNAMIPSAYELKATLLLEFEQPEVRQVKLAELLGLEKEISILINGKHKVSATCDTSQIDEKKLSSVQFLTFYLGEEITTAFLNTDKVEIVTSHPASSYRSGLTKDQLTALKADLLKGTQS